MDKNNIFEHILYEIQTYLYTFQKIYEMSIKGLIENQPLFNVCRDSHFLHLRNIMDFFGSKPNKTDIHWDYVINDFTKSNFSFTLNANFLDKQGKTISVYKDGNYAIVNHTKYGCKINLQVDIPGVNEKTGKVYKVTTNYMIFPNGKLKCNTLLGGWQK